jgi:hypothetical protein
LADTLLIALSKRQQAKQHNKADLPFLLRLLLIHFTTGSTLEEASLAKCCNCLPCVLRLHVLY